MKSKIEKLGKVSITVEKDYWDKNKAYNRLTIVERQGTSTTYLSRKVVPIGIDITDRNYWITISKWADIPYEIVQEFGDSPEVVISQKVVTLKVNELQELINNINDIIGEGGSIDERIVTAKSELIGGASEEGNTFKKIEDRLSDVEESVGEGGSVDEKIAVGVNIEKNRAQAAEELLRELYESLSQSQPIPKTAEEWAAMTSFEEGIIYRVAGTTSYTDYMYNGTTTIPMAVYNNAIDEKPTAGSDNLVKSGGVHNAIVYKLQELTANRKSQCSFNSSGVVVSESSSSRVIDSVPCAVGKKYIINFENIGDILATINIAIFSTIPKVDDTIIQDSYANVVVARNTSGNYMYEANYDGYISLSYVYTRVSLAIKEIVYVKDKVEEVEEETKANTLELSLQEEKIDNTSESLELFMESEHKAIRMSVNLFDKNSVINNAKLSSAGRVVSNEEYCISNYIPVTTGQTFIASIDSAGIPSHINLTNYCVFDENKGFLSYHTYFGESPTTISEENAKYIACTIKKSISVDKIQIQEGTERTSYEEFGKLYVYDTTPVNTLIKIKADGTGDYTSIRQAFETEGDGKVYEIYPGTYNVADDFTEEEINNASYEPDGSGFCGIRVPNNSKVVGIGNKTEIIVKLELDPNVYGNLQRFSIGTFNLFGNCEIENLTILAVYTRTPIHDDFRAAVNSTHIIRNCILRNEIAMRDVSHGYGLGLRSGETIEMYDCDIYPTMICHSNTGFTKSPKVLMQNCNIYGNLSLSDANSGVQSFVTLNNCSWGTLNITSSLEVPYLKCYINSECTNPVFLSGIYDIYGAFVRKYPAKSTISKGQCVYINITNSSIPYCSPVLTDFDYAIGIALNDAIAEDMVTVFMFNKYILATLCGIEEGDFGNNVSFNNGTLAIGDTNIIGKIVPYQGRKVVKLLK